MSSLTSFLSALENYGNPSLWANLNVDGNGEWIWASIKANTLVIAHDGSYMPEQSTNLCSAGVIIYCQHTSQWLKTSIVEQSEATSNYRGELLGAVMALLIIRAATTGVTNLQPCMTLFCDNNGVLSHGNSPRTSLPKKQQQADLIWFLKYLSTSRICPILWKWVEGHAVEWKGWNSCSLLECFNHQANILAKDALLVGLNGAPLMEGDFPLELVQIILSGKRICGSIRQALEADWGHCTAKALFDEKEYCENGGLLSSLVGLSSESNDWIPKNVSRLTKHVSEFCGNNIQRYYWSKGQHSPKCKFCLTEDKYTMHTCRCREAGRECMFHISVKELFTWLTSTLGDQQVAATVEKYLLACSKSQMIECVHGTDQDLQAAAADNDQLGWDSMIGGRISSKWLMVVGPLILKTRQKMPPQVLGTKFIDKLPNNVHKQWIYRNLVLHYRGKDGLMIPEHQDIMNQVESHSLTDPDSLLPQHRLLMDADFGVLGSDPTSDRLTWLADMNSTIVASNLSQAGTLTPAAEAYFAEFGNGSTNLTPS
jgi:hypothetical protein